MRVFVTGATGFVGSHVVSRLVEAGHHPICMVRASSDTGLLDRQGVQTVLGSLGELNGLGDTLKEVDAVIHIAGAIKVRDTDDFYRINGAATGELARLASLANPGLRRFIFVSSVSAQGPSSGALPRALDEPAAPVSHYGRSKLAGERALLELAEQMPVTIFRPPPVYGPRDHDMLAAFKFAKYGLAPVFGDGSGLLSLIYVEDLAGALVAALEVEHASPAIFPIDDGAVHTWESLTRDFGLAMGKTARHIRVPRAVFRLAGGLSEAFGKLSGQAMIFNRDKVREMAQTSWVCGHAALREQLGWKPEWPIERGARRTADWYVTNGWL